MGETNYNVKQVRIVPFEINALDIQGLPPNEKQLWIFPDAVEAGTHVSILTMLDRANGPVLLHFDAVRTGTSLPEVQELDPDVHVLSIIQIRVPCPADVLDGKHRLVSTEVVVPTWFNLDDEVIFTGVYSADPPSRNDA